MAKLIGYPANGYVKRMKVTALEIKDTTSEAWVKTPVDGRVFIIKKESIVKNITASIIEKTMRFV